MSVPVKDRRAVQDVADVPARTDGSGPAEAFMLALRHGASVDEAQRVGEMLLTFQDREEARDAERAFNAAFASAMGEMPPIPKGKRADRGRAGSFWYAPIETILGKAQPVLARHGLHLGFDVVTSGDGSSVTVTAIVRHEGGHSIRSDATAKVQKFSDANTALQNTQGTVTGLQRTLAMAILGLAVGGEEEASAYEAAPAGPDTSHLMERLRAANTMEDLAAVRDDIARLPRGDARTAVIAAATEAQRRIQEAADA